MPVHRPVDRRTVSLRRCRRHDGVSLAWRPCRRGDDGSQARFDIPASGERDSGEEALARGCGGRDRGRRACRAGRRHVRDGAACIVSEALKRVAIDTLTAVANDAQAPAAARAAAARTLLELIGAIGRLQVPESGSETPVAELSAIELEAEIARLGALIGGAGAGPERKRRAPRRNGVVPPYRLI